MKTAPLHILLVDDNADDRFLTSRVLRHLLSAASTVNAVNSGNEAISYLIGEGKYSDRSTHPFPSLLICDLEMPDGDGLDVLEFMQCNAAWSVVPRIIFSAACREDDVRTAFQLGASAYHEKPVLPADNTACLQRIVDYWSNCSTPQVDSCGRLLISSVPGVRGTRYAPPAGSDIMRRVQSALGLGRHPA